MADRINMTSPVGRLVSGSVYIPKTKNMEGEPLKTKDGDDKVLYYFYLAIPKTGETSWTQTVWGQQLVDLAKIIFPTQYTAAGFSWKIQDGDDTSKIGPTGIERKPLCEREGYAGNWIMSFESNQAPKVLIYDHQTKEAKITDQPEAIMLGYYVQVAFTATGNGAGTSKKAIVPGLKLYHQGVCRIAFGDVIIKGFDIEEANFGTNTLPAGASLTPVAPSHAAMSAVTAAATMPTPPNVSMATPIAVTPHPAILTPPVATPVAPPLPVAKTILPHPQYNPMGTATYDQMTGIGWTDATLKQYGLMM